MDMEARMFKAYAKGDEKIQLKNYIGTFYNVPVPYHSLSGYDHDENQMCGGGPNCKAAVAKYEATTPVDSIICLDGLEVVGAFLAEELAKAGVLSMNAHKTIYIVTPEFHANGQMLFRDNTQNMVKNRNTVILMGSITTGTTLRQCMETVLYYGGKIQGVSAIFSAVNKVAGIEINAVYDKQDIPDYESYPAEKCPMCQRKERIDAIVNGYGYSKL